MTPVTKYLWTKGYTHRIGRTVRIIVTAWMLAPKAVEVDPAAAAPSEAALEAPAMRLRRYSVIGNSSVFVR